MHWVLSALLRNLCRIQKISVLAISYKSENTMHSEGRKWQMKIKLTSKLYLDYNLGKWLSNNNFQYHNGFACFWTHSMTCAYQHITLQSQISSVRTLALLRLQLYVKSLCMFVVGQEISSLVSLVKFLRVVIPYGSILILALATWFMPLYKLLQCIVSGK